MGTQERGQRAKAIRKMAGLTISQFAILAEVGRNTVINFEQGKRVNTQSAFSINRALREIKD